MPLIALFLTLQRYWRIDSAVRRGEGVSPLDRRPATVGRRRDSRRRSGRRSTTWPRVAGVSAGHGLPGAQRRPRREPGGAGRRSSAAIPETGYVVNRHARSLVTQRSAVGGVRAVRAAGAAVRGPELPRRCCAAARRRCAEHDIALVLMIAGNDEDRERVGRLRHRGHVDGVLLVSTHTRQPAGRRAARARACPWSPAAAPRAASGLAYVAADDRDGARQMIRYLRRPGPPADRHDHRPARHPRRRRPAAPATATCSGDGCDEATHRHGDYTQASGEAAMAAAARAGARTSTRCSSPPT